MEDGRLVHKRGFIMGATVLNIFDYKKKDLSNKDLFSIVTHETVPLLQKLQNSVGALYATPGRQNIWAPKEWNPTIKYKGFTFDPYMVGLDEQVEDKSEYFKARSGRESMQAITEVFDYIKEKMATKKVHLTLNEVHYAEHYIVTKEDVTKNSIIIGFFYLKDNYYERFLIKDLKKFCKAASTFNNLSKKILKKWKPIEGIMTVEESLRRQLATVRPIVSSAQEIPIQSIYIEKMIEYFTESEKKVVSILS
jgi:hypothetical protein